MVGRHASASFLRGIVRGEQHLVISISHCGYPQSTQLAEVQPGCLRAHNDTAISLISAWSNIQERQSCRFLSSQ